MYYYFPRLLITADISGFSVHNLKKYTYSAGKEHSTLWWPRKALGNFPRKKKEKKYPWNVEVKLDRSWGRERGRMNAMEQPFRSWKWKRIMANCDFVIFHCWNSLPSLKFLERITARNFNYRSIYILRWEREKKNFRQLLIVHFPIWCSWLYSMDTQQCKWIICLFEVE